MLHERQRIASTRTCGHRERADLSARCSSPRHPRLPTSTCPTSSSGPSPSPIGRRPSPGSAGRQPISFVKEQPIGPFPAGPGYWAITRHADVIEASRQPELFCSGEGTNIFDMPLEFREFFGSMINMDDPRHARLRKIVSAGFTPRMLKKLEGDVQRAAAQIVDDVSALDREATGGCTATSSPTHGRPAPADDHLRHDGHPARAVRLRVRAKQHHPRRGRSRVRGHWTADVATAILTAGAELSQLVIEWRASGGPSPPTTSPRRWSTPRSTASASPTPSWARSSSCSRSPGNETTRNAISHGLRR